MPENGALPSLHQCLLSLHQSLTAFISLQTNRSKTGSRIWFELRTKGLAGKVNKVKNLTKRVIASLSLRQFSILFETDTFRSVWKKVLKFNMYPIKQDVSMILYCLSHCHLPLVVASLAIPSFLSPPIKCKWAQSYNCSFTECDPAQVLWNSSFCHTAGEKNWQESHLLMPNINHPCKKKKELLRMKTSVINASHHSKTSTLPSRHIADDNARGTQSAPRAKKWFWWME